MFNSATWARFYAVVLLGSLTSGVLAPVAFAADLYGLNARSEEIGEGVLSEALAEADRVSSPHDLLDAVSSALLEDEVDQTVVRTFINYLYRLLLLDEGQHAMVTVTGANSIDSTVFFGQVASAERSCPSVTSSGLPPSCKNANLDTIRSHCPAIQPNGP
ncbi:MAG: hypothetical protein R3284_07750 [Rubricoccaceae bacterium]|nr:hypothetical protein [Rubricoccaceae bacterium]